MEKETKDGNTSEISKEKYKELLEKSIEEKAWAEKFIKSKDWQKLAGYISRGWPKQSPYGMDSIEKIKEQGGFIRGLAYPETVLVELIRAGKEASDELKNNPDAE